MILNLTKHHGLGNDFLVLLDPSGSNEVTADLARRVLDRRVGIGADGLLHVCKAGDGADLAVTVWNADGSIAETSGNGLRCAGQAAIDAGLIGGGANLRTGGSVREIHIGEEWIPGERRIGVTMGVPRLETVRKVEIPGVTTGRAAELDVGNPHLVIEVDSLDGLDDEVMGELSRTVLGRPVNLEAVVADPDGTRVQMRVWERGVGETRACGSGAVATAAAVRYWGADHGRSEIEVFMPGGPAAVAFRPDGEAVLTGPAKFIGRIEVDPDKIQL